MNYHKAKKVHWFDVLSWLIVLIVLMILPRTVMAGENITEIGDWKIEEDINLKGRYLIAGKVTIAAGVNLTIEGGSEIYLVPEKGSLVVEGSIIVEGTEDSPVLFSTPGGVQEGSLWKGITIKGSQGKVSFRRAIFHSAETAVAIEERQVSFTNCIFEYNGIGLSFSNGSRGRIIQSGFSENDVGLGGNMSSRVEIQECRFERNEKYGIVLKSTAGGRITGSWFIEDGGFLLEQAQDVFVKDNTFRKTGIGLVTDQVRHDVRISGNTFEDGDFGLQIVDFATPWVACCIFRNLTVGVMATRFTKPLLINNLFEGNKTGLYANQKSNFPVKYNVFRDNERAVFSDLSSYPVLENNNFVGNGRDVVLGQYMSADWEAKVGSSRLTVGQAKQRGSIKLKFFQDHQEEYKGELDARNNWWGEKTTAEMKGKGADADISSIEDYFDKNEVSYPEFGEGLFKVDRVFYHPWATEEISEAGPKENGCGDLVIPQTPGTGE